MVVVAVVVWHTGSALVSINEVNLRRARLVIPGEGHLCRYVTSHPGQLSLAIPSWHNECLPKGDDALRLESKGMHGSCVGGR